MTTLMIVGAILYYVIGVISMIHRFTVTEQLDVMFIDLALILTIFWAAWPFLVLVDILVSLANTRDGPPIFRRRRK